MKIVICAPWQKYDKAAKGRLHFSPSISMHAAESWGRKSGRTISVSLSVKSFPSSELKSLTHAENMTNMSFCVLPDT